jgi:diguanylate cyclase (GGDEF)-like protein
MGTTASPFLDSIELPGAGLRPSASTLARRARQRRQIQVMIAASYVLDALVLQLYAYAGTIPVTIGLAYAACGLASVAFYLVLSETGFTERLKDHYFVTPQLIISTLIMLGFAYVAPQVGMMFLCELFLVFSFGALRATPGQTALLWTLLTLGLAALFLLTDKPVTMPHDGPIERFATMSVFVLGIGRCMFLGIFSSALRHSLYQRGLKLREAYRRIEELAELDELTGALNRRSIMRALDEEIARAQRLNNPCAVALIDLDWFKRINDAYGHPTGDEVLRTFAITIFANIRTVDKFGRYGGEEFLLLLPDTSEHDAAQMLDRLRMIIAELDWSAFSEGMRVTISAGVTALRKDENTDTLLARADRALYASKAGGRNRVTTG